MINSRIYFIDVYEAPFHRGIITLGQLFICSSLTCHMRKWKCKYKVNTIINQIVHEVLSL